MRQKLKPLCEWNYHSIGFDRRATVDGQEWVASDHLAMVGEEKLANDSTGLKNIVIALRGNEGLPIYPVAIGAIPSGSADAVWFSDGSAIWDRYYIAIIARWPDCQWKSATIRLVGGSSRRSIIAARHDLPVAMIAPLDIDPPEELKRFIEEATR